MRGAAAVSNTRGQPAVGQTAGGSQEYGARSAAYDPAAGYPAGQAQAGYPVEAAPSVGAAAGTVLAGVLMIVGGIWGFLVGLAVVLKSGFFVHVNSTYPYHWNVNSWGWTHVALGVVVFAAGVCVLLGMVWARVVGVILATLSAIASFLFLPYYPVWSIILIAIDVYIIWALVAGPRRYRRV
jgi:hypothetical protein